MTNPFDLPSVIKCPSCGRTNGVPTRGGTFDCMFCGAKIVLPSAPTSSSFSTPAPLPSMPTARPAASQPPVSKPAAQPAPAPQALPQWPSLDLPQPLRPPAAAPLPPPTAIPPAEGAFAGGGAFSTAGAFDPGSAEVLRYRWYSGRAIFDLIVSGFTAAFFLFLFYLALPSKNLSQIPWLFVLFAATFLFSSLSSLYRGLARILNTTRIKLESGVLSARHGPIPWSGARLDVDAIERIGVDQQRVQQNRRSSTTRYNLAAFRKDGGKVVLVPGLNSQADGEAMAGILNQRLGLKN